MSDGSEQELPLRILHAQHVLSIYLARIKTIYSSYRFYLVVLAETNKKNAHQFSQLLRQNFFFIWHFIPSLPLPAAEHQSMSCLGEGPPK